MTYGPLLLEHKPETISFRSMYAETAAPGQQIVSLAAAIGFILPPDEMIAIPSFADGNNPFLGMVEFFSQYYDDKKATESHNGQSHA